MSEAKKIGLNKLYTVGHSDHEIGYFVELLKKHNIGTIADVRSMPRSKFAPQYNKEALKQYLEQNEISYIYLGDLLGARHEDRGLLFSGGKVDFKKVQQTKFFQDGIVRLNEEAEKGANISLMCSEKEAFDCHRFGLVGEYLTKNSVEVNHIYPDKVVSQKDLEVKMLKKYKKRLPGRDLFYLDVTEESQLKWAYKLRNKDIAFRAWA